MSTTALPRLLELWGARDPVYSLTGNWVRQYNDFNKFSFLVTEEEAAAQRKHLDLSINVPFSIVINDTREQFQLFRLLEKFFQTPLTFKMQMLCTISPASQQILNERSVFSTLFFYHQWVLLHIYLRKISSDLGDWLYYKTIDVMQREQQFWSGQNLPSDSQWPRLRAVRDRPSYTAWYLENKKTKM